MPSTTKKKHIHSIHGQNREDNYHWLKDDTRKNEEVLNHLNNENDFADSYFKDTKELQESLFKEMVGRMKEDDSIVPYKIKGYYYYSRTEKGKNHRIYCRKKGSLNGKEEILLDMNELAKTNKNVVMGGYAMSPDQNILAYSIDEKGKEIYTMHFKDLRTGRLYVDKVPNISPGIVWANDNRTVFYTKMNKAFRHYQAFSYELGKSDSEKLLYTEEDELFDVGFSKTNDEKYILMTTGSFTSSEVRYLDARRPKGKWSLVQRRLKDLEYQVEHHRGHFYILNNSESVNFKISKAPVSKPYISYWKDFIPHDKEALITQMHIQKDRLIYVERRDGLKKIKYVQYRGPKGVEIKFNEAVYTASLGINPNYNSNHLRIRYESPITPQVVYDYQFDRRDFVVKKQKEVPTFRPHLYTTERIMVPARDGETIPVTLVYKKGFKKGDSIPTLLYGYGSYGYTIDPRFRSSVISLVDRNFICAIAHIRGSQAKGRLWYDNGKLKNKKNTFNDFVDVAKYLIKEKYTARNKLAIRGGSAGGLLMGAVVNQEPELFKAVVAEVPFVDVLSTILDPNLRFSVQEYQQWGNPNVKEDYEYILSYSPYDRIQKASYPSILAVAGLYDSRVNYWEPAKWVAKLRDFDQDGGVIMLRTNMEAGHAGDSGRYDALKEEAETQSFILKELGEK